MPSISVSRALLHPALADHFNVKRREQRVNGFGEVSVVTNVIRNVVGVVAASHPNDLERLDDNQRMGRNLTIVSQFKLRGPALGPTATEYQPDTVIWEGNTYLVKLIDPYPQFGPGFTQAIVGSMDFIDRPVTPRAPNTGRVNFSDPQQSPLIATVH